MNGLCNYIVQRFTAPPRHRREMVFLHFTVALLAAVTAASLHITFPFLLVPIIAFAGGIEEMLPANAMIVAAAVLRICIAMSLIMLTLWLIAHWSMLVHNVPLP